MFHSWWVWAWWFGCITVVSIGMYCRHISGLGQTPPVSTLGWRTHLQPLLIADRGPLSPVLLGSEMYSLLYAGHHTWDPAHLLLPYKEKWESSHSLNGWSWAMVLLLRVVEKQYFPLYLQKVPVYTVLTLGSPFQECREHYLPESSFLLFIPTGFTFSHPLF